MHPVNNPTPSVPRELKQWYVLASNSFMAPEGRAIAFAGICEVVHATNVLQTSSAVKIIDSRTILTEGGSIYKLIGEPNEKWLDYLKSTLYWELSEKDKAALVKHPLTTMRRLDMLPIKFWSGKKKVLGK